MIVKDILGDDILIVSGRADKEFEGAYCGDLLSMVMARGIENSVWITVQKHINVLAVAELIDFSVILFAEGQEPESDTVAKAEEMDVTLLKTKLSVYEAAVYLYKKGIQ